MVNLFKKDAAPEIKGLYIMAFTPEKLSPEPLKNITQIADGMLRSKNPVFKQLMEVQSGPQTRIEIANLQFVPFMHTPQTMQTTLAGWLKSHNVTFSPSIGKNFFPHGMKDQQGKEAYILFYFVV